MYSAVRQREAIVRAFASEARALPESIRSCTPGIPAEEEGWLCRAKLKEAQDLGLVRKDVDLSAATDFIRDCDP